MTILCLNHKELSHEHNNQKVFHLVILAYLLLAAFFGLKHMLNYSERYEIRVSKDPQIIGHKSSF